MTQLNINKRVKGVLPSRAEQLEKLKCQEFDVLVIGGGATGSGVSRGKSNYREDGLFCTHLVLFLFCLQCALDAQTRGLKTAMVELDDFASGTSSRSTKLIHGGLRYLQKVKHHQQRNARREETLA